MIYKGTLVVRLVNPNSDTSAYYHQIGYIFSVETDSRFDSADYGSGSILKHNYRRATPYEEYRYNLTGGMMKNIDEIPVSPIVDFHVEIGTDKNSFRSYINICKQYNIPFNPSWHGGMRRYGVTKDGKPIANPPELNGTLHKFVDLTSFKDYLSHPTPKKRLINKHFSFSVSLKSSNALMLMVEYKKLCRKFGIRYEHSWVGGNFCYGVAANGNPLCMASAHGEFKFYSLSDFENFLNNNLKQKTDEVHRQDPEESGRSIDGGSRISSVTKQIATGVRPTGYAKRAKVSETWIGHVALSRKSILAEHN